MAGVVFSKSSNLNNSIFGKSEEPIKAIIEQRAEAFEQMSALPKVFKMEKSKNWAEKYTSLTSMDGFMPVGEGGAYPKDEMQEGFSKSLEAETWKDQFSITREMIEDSKLGSMRGKPAAFTEGYYRSREKFGACMFMAGVNGTAPKYGNRSYAKNVLSADGKNVFAMDHPGKVKGLAQSNKFAGAFSVDNLSKLETRMQSFRDDNANILAVSPDTILIPNDWQLKKEVFAAIGADKDPATANNGANFQFGRWNVIIWPYLNQYFGTDKQPWILLDSHYNEMYGGAVWIDRVPLEVRSWVDDGNDNNVWNGYARFTCGFVDWRFAAVAGITGGTAL